MIDKEFAHYLIAKFGSPLYAYDLEEIEHRAEDLHSILPEGSVLFYSFKANPLPAIGALLRGFGCGAEISSIGELKAAFEAGFSSSNILYSGPGKTKEEIYYALSVGVIYFSCESWNDLARLEFCASELDLEVKVLLRVNPATAPIARLAMTGVPSQFGFEEEHLITNVEKLQSLHDNIEIVGTHVYYGTQIGGCETLMSTLRNAIHTAERLSELFGFPFRIVDVGGGFPWPYATRELGLDLTELQPALSELSDQRQLTSSAQLWFESGRYLSASSGTLLTRVLDVKESKSGKKYLVLDAGINHLGGMSGLGRILQSVISIAPAEPIKSTETDIVDVVGPLCSPLDCIARDIKIPGLRLGDLICIPNVGAYGLTASLIGFLSRPSPVEVAYRGKQCVNIYRLRTGHKKIA